MNAAHLFRKIASISVFIPFMLLSCVKSEKETENTSSPNHKIPKKELTSEFKAYWYEGNAEITSYELNQARYGEMRKGTAVMVYVTEPFLADKQVKADAHHPDNIQVLKLNATKDFLTGIYPYSIMESSFYPVHDYQHAVKVSLSVQEWCGHVYAQINNRDVFEVISHSYFENEADQNLSLEKTHLENELWNKIRINPKNLPTGELKIIPSLEFLRLTHKALKSYTANASLQENDSISTYSVSYPELERTLSINFSKTFPYTIESWTDTYKSGFGSEAIVLSSAAKKMKRIKSPYWQKNANSDVFLRDSLSL